jgi:predicted small secreted protein
MAFDRTAVEIFAVNKIAFRALGFRSDTRSSARHLSEGCFGRSSSEMFHSSAWPLHLESKMTNISTKIVIALTAALFLTSCANTIRGAGRDVSNTANATENAAKDIAN